MFAVSDIKRAARFYRDVLALPQAVYDVGSQWAEFDCRNVTLALKGAEPVAAGHIALAVEDVQAAYDQLKRQGIRITKELRDYGCCTAFEISDPDGNRVIVHRRADGTFG